MEHNQRTRPFNQTDAEPGSQGAEDALNQGRDDCFMDIDRMVNEGLGGGNVTINNGKIDDSTTDTMDHPESAVAQEKQAVTES